MKIKIGTEVAHVTRDSDTTFKVKRSKGTGILWRLPAQLVFKSFGCHSMQWPGWI